LSVPVDLQERVRQFLHDPTAELLIWCGNPIWAYTDCDGRPRDTEVEDRDRVVTTIERDGSPLAAIVHERAKPPELVEEVTAAIGVEVERDRFLFELERSERRNRALLRAIPDKMFRIRRDGVILDIQENMEYAPTTAPVTVGSSAYDASVPPEVIHRIMAAGRLALDTGSLQTIEWQRDVEGDRSYLEGRFIPSGDDEFIVVVRDVTGRKRHEVEQAALHTVALAVAEDRPERIFDLVTEEVGGVLEAHSANLLRYDKVGSGSVIVGRWSVPGVFSGPIGYRFPTQEGTVAHRVYTTGLPVRLDLDDRTDPVFGEYMKRVGANSIVAAPVIVTGRIWGVITARLSPPHAFPRRAEERLAKFARLVSLAMANEEAREQLAASRARLLSTADAERRRLERNLHDGAQQRLVSLSLYLRHAQNKLASEPELAGELLADASRELDIALEELRELARGIHPAVLTDRGLGPALLSLADRSNVPVEIELLAEGRLPARLEAAVYYVVSESLTNVAKYAGASFVSIRVARENGSVVVEIADDGSGGADPQRGSGLRGLVDRIEALDGSLTVESPPGRGTTVRATIPS
jgi:signal transduction histidine kinase/PAS domain-containing protein